MTLQLGSDGSGTWTVCLTPKPMLLALSSLYLTLLPQMKQETLQYFALPITIMWFHRDHLHSSPNSYKGLRDCLDSAWNTNNTELLRTTHWERPQWEKTCNSQRNFSWHWLIDCGRDLLPGTTGNLAIFPLLFQLVSDSYVFESVIR